MKKVIVLFIFCLSFLDAGDFEKGIEAADNNDYVRASVYFQKACDRGEANGCFNLGIS